jgi:rod shape-determining protein MreD
MQTTYSSSRILQPVRLWFILLSLIVALVLNFIPTASVLWIPDWIALVLVFWSIREPRHVGMGSAFLLGVAMDVADASLMGQHALAYVMITYLAGLLSRRILWFPLGQQALHVAPLLLLAQAIQVAVRLVPGVDFPGLSYFIGPFIGAVLWLPLTFVLLLPQYQPIEHDANRPI